MIRNMGNADRITRVLIVVAIAILYFTKTVTGTFAIVLLVAGVIFLLTSLVSFCPVYSLLGINTCKVRKAN